MARERPRVAIVGAGPAGAFAAAALLRANGDTDIDLIERLPTPWGLLRGGVAPDHQEIKRLEDTFDRQTLRHGCRETSTNSSRRSKRLPWISNTRGNHSG